MNTVTETQNIFYTGSSWPLGLVPCCFQQEKELANSDSDNERPTKKLKLAAGAEAGTLVDSESASVTSKSQHQHEREEQQPQETLPTLVTQAPEATQVSASRPAAQEQQNMTSTDNAAEQDMQKIAPPSPAQQPVAEVATHVQETAPAPAQHPVAEEAAANVQETTPAPAQHSVAEEAAANVQGATPAQQSAAEAVTSMATEQVPAASLDANAMQSPTDVPQESSKHPADVPDTAVPDNTDKRENNKVT